MYFNLDNQRKQKILNYYKNEADNYRRKKQEAKKQQIQEEINYLREREEKQHESDLKLIQENYRKKNALMQEYLEMLKKTKNYLPGYHFKSKNNDVIINNWGKSKEESLEDNIHYNNNYYHSNNYKNNSFDCNKYNSNSFNELNPIEKARLIIKPIDSMNKFLTDEQNENEVKNYFLRQRKNKENFYKELLYSQYENTAKKNKNIFGTEDMLILKQKKKKLITENPYREKNEYGFGNSNLVNNPILNPENNMRYNKYFKDFYPDTPLEKIEIGNKPFKDNDFGSLKNLNNLNNDNQTKVDNYSNNFNEYNNYINKNNNTFINNYMNEKRQSNMATNGENIINNYKINDDILKDKKNYRLSRNFSDINNGFKTLNNNYNINYNNDFESRNQPLNNATRSMSQIYI